MKALTYCIIACLVLFAIGEPSLHADIPALAPGEQIIAGGADGTAPVEQTKPASEKTGDVQESQPAKTTATTPESDPAYQHVQDAVIRARAVKHMLSTTPWSAAQTQQERVLLNTPRKQTTPRQTTQVESTVKTNNVVAPVNTRNTNAADTNTTSVSHPIRALARFMPASDTVTAWINTVPPIRTPEDASTTPPWAPGFRVVTEVPTQPQTIDPPALERRMTCELKLVRISDGKVLAQASAPAIYGNMDRLAEYLIDTLLQSAPHGSTITCVQLCNRRGTPQGRLISEEMSRMVSQAVLLNSSVRLADQVDLRGTFTDERKMEHPVSLISPDVQVLLGGADYLIVGGIALNEEFVTLPQ